VEHSKVMVVSIGPYLCALCNIWKEYVYNLNMYKVFHEQVLISELLQLALGGASRWNIEM
jgi:hypothetical protein